MNATEGKCRLTIAEGERVAGGSDDRGDENLESEHCKLWFC